jgi:hypothetical protein
MNKELQDKLYKDFPKIFAQRKLPMTQTCMCWGVDTGDGWYALLYALCELIQRAIDNDEKITQLEATQVKEKFGGLRFYYTGGNTFIYNIITMAEHMSFYTCEVCGTTKDAAPNNDGWITTLCPNCREERIKKKD